MNRETRMLINTAIDAFAENTGLKIVHRYEAKTKKRCPDGILRIVHQDMGWDLGAQVKQTVTRTIVGLESGNRRDDRIDRILLTKYVTPPIADLMKKNGLFFIDAAGNAYINKPPLYVFIKGNRPPENAKTPTTRRLWKPSGLKVVFALLNVPDMVNMPYRQIAATTGTALGTVEWVMRDLKDMGFLLDMGRRKRLMKDTVTLMKRWVEAYPEQLRPKLVIERLAAEAPGWWQDIEIKNYHAFWGGEVAAAKLTRRLKPENVVIYADQLPDRLIVEKKLRKNPYGETEILKPFWNFDQDLAGLGIVPPLLVYTDLMATGDDRNVETAGIIYEEYLASFDWKDWRRDR